MGASQTKKEQQSTKPFDSTKVFALFCGIEKYDAVIKPNTSRVDDEFEKRK